ncbi:hypothetical protein Aple_075430 [Acrocarpospora pleiomorpha]|uniref:PknH-like extracellular domain-containing protein n=1 Tax=Acrocarpospora pleiomorpha TaxID=90975 RepID=A0A5M3XTN3_9ACTN|nr:hypothetical protein [Acrocarpospora pleiomorpha]GES24644.1 hypothetical protein Aple_075430 [Acrocarpospora pleiomorpha]
MIIELVLTGALAVAAPVAPLTDAEMKRALLAGKDLGKGVAILTMDLDGAFLSAFRVDEARCMDALKAYDSVFGGMRPSAWIIGKVNGLHQVFTGGPATIKQLKTAASKVATSCDGQVGFRRQSEFKKKKVANLGDATYAFEVTFDSARFPGADMNTYVSEFVVVAYKSSVVVYQGLTDTKSTWPTTVKTAKKAVAKVKKVYSRRG